MLSVIPAMQADTVAQEKSIDLDQQTVSFEGYCGNEDCIVNTLKKCELSETTVRSASNTTMIISIGEKGVYQGKSVCMIAFNEKASSSTNSASLQSISCKFPTLELQNLKRTDNIEDLMQKLAASDHCQLQVPLMLIALGGEFPVF
jgi:hypothetical protein